MSKPLVAIVGRPNVGKSTFFNKMAGKRISIVDDMPGVTRDRITADAEWLGHSFTLIDTGGIDPKSDDVLLSQMREQAEIAMDLADVILFMCDIQSGLTAADEEIATMLRKANRPVILAVNKVDHVGEPPTELYEFYNLGLGEVYLVGSALAALLTYYEHVGADGTCVEVAGTAQSLQQGEALACIALCAGALDIAQHGNLEAHYLGRNLHVVHILLEHFPYICRQLIHCQTGGLYPADNREFDGAVLHYIEVAHTALRHGLTSTRS